MQFLATHRAIKLDYLFDHQIMFKEPIENVEDSFERISLPLAIKIINWINTRQNEDVLSLHVTLVGAGGERERIRFTVQEQKIEETNTSFESICFVVKDSVQQHLVVLRRAAEMIYAFYDGIVGVALKELIPTEDESHILYAVNQKHDVFWPAALHIERLIEGVRFQSELDLDEALCELVKERMAKLERKRERRRRKEECMDIDEKRNWHQQPKRPEYEDPYLRPNYYIQDDIFYDGTGDHQTDDYKEMAQEYAEMLKTQTKLFAKFRKLLTPEFDREYGTVPVITEWRSKYSCYAAGLDPEAQIMPPEIEIDDMLFCIKWYKAELEERWGKSKNSIRMKTRLYWFHPVHLAQEMFQETQAELGLDEHGEIIVRVQ